MSELLYQGDLDANTLHNLVDHIFIPGGAESFALLEEVPAQYMEESRREKGLQFVAYHEGLKVCEWDKGRIFNQEGELRWRRRENTYQTIYAGSSQRAALYLKAVEMDFEITPLESYYLWGEKLSPEDQETLGLEQGTPHFLELQIPRAFVYPVKANSGFKRCRINIIRYNERSSGITQYFRMHSLQEVE